MRVQIGKTHFGKLPTQKKYRVVVCVEWRAVGTYQQLTIGNYQIVGYANFRTSRKSCGWGHVLTYSPSLGLHLDNIPIERLADNGDKINAEAAELFSQRKPISFKLIKIRTQPKLMGWSQKGERFVSDLQDPNTKPLVKMRATISPRLRHHQECDFYIYSNGIEHFICPRRRRLVSIEFNDMDTQLIQDRVSKCVSQFVEFVD